MTPGWTISTAQWQRQKPTYRSSRELIRSALGDPNETVM
jgi:hypothetical protein